MSADDKQVETALSAAGGCLFALLTYPLLCAYRALVYTSMWGWFAPALGLPAIGYGTMGVLAAFGALLTWRQTKSARPVYGMVAMQLAAISLFWATAWAFHRWGSA